MLNYLQFVMATNQIKNSIKQEGQKSPRPEIVPRLEFKGLVLENPEENVLNQPVSKACNIKTPSAQSTVSWGTPLAPPYGLTSKDKEFGGTVYRPCTHMKHKQDKRNPLQNPITHKATTQNMVEDRKENYDPFKSKQPKAARTEVNSVPSFNKIPATNPMPNETKDKNKSKYWYLDEELKEKKPVKPKPVNTEQVIDDMAMMQAKYTSQPYTGLHDVKKSAAEDDLISKQKNEIMEQVLVDQLSRHVLSDVEQDRDPARQNPADPASRFNTAPLRFRSRRLHETKVSTAGAATEAKLKDRITFGARIVTRDGRDALRELFGFYFHTDQTLTVYEFRVFGKNSTKALPVIDRGKYAHVVGRRKDKRYEPNDFQLGRNLTFRTNKQPHLPDSIRKHPIVTMRICEANSSAPSRDWDISTTDRDDGSDTALERNDRKITQNVQDFIRNKIRGRSVSAVVGLGKLFRLIDSSGDGLLDKRELAEALETFEISLPQKDFDAVWRVVDENNDGAIDYGEFMRAFIGEMNEHRKQIVRKVFKKLDPHKTGKATSLDLQKLYSAKKHPAVVEGRVNQADMEKQFLSSFADVCSGSEVTFTQFEEYYEGLSIAMERDDDFINMMRNCWGV